MSLIDRVEAGFARLSTAINAIKTSVFDVITLDAVTDDPTAPPDGFGKIYAKNIAGQVVAKFKGPSDWDYPLMPDIAFNNIAFARPNFGTVVSVVGCSLTTVGTISTPVLASTSLLASAKRWRVTSAATAGALASQRSSATLFWRGNAEGLGGFRFVQRCGYEIGCADQLIFFGVAATTAAPTKLDPLTSATIGKIGLACNSATGNWSIVSNNTGAAPSVVNLGSSFPVLPNVFNELVLFSRSNGDAIGWRVTNLDTRATASGSITANLPAKAVFYTSWNYMSNNATASAIAFCSTGFTVSADI